MNSRQNATLLIATVSGLLIAGCQGSHHHQDQKKDKADYKASPADLPPSAKLVGSGTGRFDYHVIQDGEVYVIDATDKKDLLYSGPFVAGQIIKLDPDHARLQFDGHTVEEPGLKVTDQIEIYEDHN